MSFIESIKGYEILDSRGNPTIEVEVTTSNGVKSIASVPSGASTGSREAHELRDGNSEKFLGLGVKKAVNNINTKINKVLNRFPVTNQRLIDLTMIDLDNTKTKSNLGANAILGVSLACAKAGALTCGLPLYQYLGGVGSNIIPTPLINILNGGAHADNNVDIQEFMIIPNIEGELLDNLSASREVIFNLKKILQDQNFSTSVGDEGGFSPNLVNNEQAIKFIVEAINKSGYKPGEDIYIALDIAANELYDPKTCKYIFKGENKEFNLQEIIRFYEYLTQTYPIISIEDPLYENDWQGWQELTKVLGNRVQLVGDDLFVTNLKFLEKGSKENVANAILIKPNQVGTLTETLDTIRYAQNNGYNVVISHRSGETEESIISDLAISVSCGEIKIGSLNRTDRLVKYNRLLRVEQEIYNSKYLGIKHI